MSRLGEGVSCLGGWVHNQVIIKFLDSNLHVGVELVHMYMALWVCL